MGLSSLGGVLCLSYLCAAQIGWGYGVDKAGYSEARKAHPWGTIEGLKGFEGKKMRLIFFRHHDIKPAHSVEIPLPTHPAEPAFFGIWVGGTCTRFAIKGVKNEKRKSVNQSEQSEQ